MDKYSLTQALEQAIERNLIVYDGDAQSGRLTVRLLALMRTIGRQNVSPKLKNIFIYQDHESDLSEAVLINPKILNLYKIQFVDIDLTKLYESFPHVSLCTGKQFVLLAEYDNNTFMLGNF